MASVAARWFHCRVLRLLAHRAAARSLSASRRMAASRSPTAPHRRADAASALSTLHTLSLSRHVTWRPDRCLRRRARDLRRARRARRSSSAATSSLVGGRPVPDRRRCMTTSADACQTLAHAHVATMNSMRRQNACGARMLYLLALPHAEHVPGAVYRELTPTRRGTLRGGTARMVINLLISRIKTPQCAWRLVEVGLRCGPAAVRGTEVPAWRHVCTGMKLS